MAQSGAITGGFLRADWSIVRQSVEGNYSIVKVVLKHTGSNTGMANGVKLSLTVHGVSSSKTIYDKNTTLTVTAQVNHNTDGTGAAKIAASYSGYGTGSSGNISGWATLDTIQRQAFLLSAPNFNDEENPTITYSNPAGNTVSSVAAAISFDGTNPDIAYRDIDKLGTSYTFELTEEERRIMRTAVDGSNSIQLYFYLRTITEGGTYIFDYKEATFTIINGAPDIIATVKDVNTTTVALTGDNTKPIKYFSRAEAYMNMVAYKEAYFTAYYIENSGNKVDTTYKHTFDNVESNIFNFYVADNRNNAVAQAVSVPMVEYVKLTCNYHAQKMPATGDMTVNCSGNFYFGSFGASDNSLTVQYRYKQQDGEYTEWLAMSATPNRENNTYTAQAVATGLDYRQTYTFQCRAIDQLMNVVSAESVIKSFPLFHWSENDFVFEIPVSFNAGSAAFEYGEWYPLLNNMETWNDFEEMAGWYQKIGKVVTIGWQLKATIASGYDTEPISITNLPYTPAVAAFGGGVAHNINIAAGFCFEGWRAGTDGTITARLQPCNNTTGGNLQISSTAYYPTGDNTAITLSGTICYMTNE